MLMRTAAVHTPTSPVLGERQRSRVHDVLRSPGQPLDATALSVMEPRFSHDLSRVRIHADEGAGQSATAVGALAYTVGSHVVFGRGQYDPRSPHGRRLLGHELAHVVQQGDVSASHRVEMGRSDDA